MIKLALEEFRQEERLEENYVRVDDWESRQAEWSNTLSVLDHFDRQFNGNKSYVCKWSETFEQLGQTVQWFLITNQFSLNRQEEQTQIRLLCGADLIMSMKDANIWPVESVRSIATKYGFIVINRFSIDLREVIDSSEILTEIKRHIEIVDHHQHPSSFDSSTKARETIQAGTRPDDILYSSVCDYIEKNGLYIKKKNAS